MPQLLPRHLRLALLAAVLGGFLAASPAIAAGGGAAVLSDCNAHNALTGTYSISQLESALRSMPADVREYTDCHDVIERQLLAQEGQLPRRPSAPRANTAGSTGGSGLPTALIVVIAVLLAAAAALGALALRRRRTV